MAALLLAAATAANLYAQGPQLSPEVRQYVSVDTPLVAITHVKLIDGTGAPAAPDQTVVIANGKIQVVGAAATVKPPAGARVMDLTGHMLIPGLIGMHDHTFYLTYGVERPIQSNYSYPRLYLGSGVTTIRTTGSMSPYAEINIKAEIDRGDSPGPHMYVTGPYIIGPKPDPRLEPFGALRAATPEAARRAVAYWAEEGATWIKVYASISRAQLAAVVDEAHQHGMKVTGHLCAVGYREAVALGIDHLEHTLFANSEYDPQKQPDVCPPTYRSAMTNLDIGGEPVRATFRDLVSRGVGMTSTLAVYECTVPGRPTRHAHVLEAFSPEMQREDSVRFATVSQGKVASYWPAVFKKTMDYEVAFVKAGGLLVAGVDPAWCITAGRGDQREFELLVEAGFTPVQAVQIMTANGAKVLGILDRVGTVTAGKNADLAVIRGDLTARAADIENVTLVFKDGVGFDAVRLVEAAKGQVGLR
ncbi:MAG: amidohydrolase family protein [Gemmatimonadetes bacterium]|nr:amidohydrolase family protein [Gemmatimonadota bacterium]